MLDICNDAGFLRTAFLIQTAIKIICAVVPLLLIISLSITIYRNVVSTDSKEIKSVILSSKNKIIAALLVVFVPTIINAFVGMIDKENYNNCIKDLTMDKINSIEKNNYNRTTTTKPKTTNRKSGVDSSGNKYINSKNGIVYQLYIQTDPRWANIHRCNSSENGLLGAVGCMITSSAVIVSAYDPSITPKEVNVVSGYDNVNVPSGFERIQCNNHSAYIIQYMTKHLFTCSYLGDKVTQDRVIAELKKGNVWVINGHHGNPIADPTGSNAYATHYMALIDYDKTKNKIYIGNRGLMSQNANDMWYAPETVLKETGQYNLCAPTQELINRYK